MKNYRVNPVHDAVAQRCNYQTDFFRLELQFEDKLLFFSSFAIEIELNKLIIFINNFTTGSARCDYRLLIDIYSIENMNKFALIITNYSEELVLCVTTVKYSTKLIPYLRI